MNLRWLLEPIRLRITHMLDRKETHLFYTDVPPAYILDVVIALQDEYRGKLVISRTPGGLVVDLAL